MNQMLQDAPQAKNSPETIDRPPAAAHPRFSKPQRVAFVPGTGFYADDSGTRNMRLSYFYPEPDRIREGVIVTVFPDSGTRYLTERFWEGRD